MIWFTNGKETKAKTHDGYLLVIKRKTCQKYIWYVYFNGSKLKNIQSKPFFTDNLAKAKRQAINVMIKHITKEDTIYKF